MFSSLNIILSSKSIYPIISMHASRRLLNVLITMKFAFFCIDFVHSGKTIDTIVSAVPK